MGWRTDPYILQILLAGQFRHQLNTFPFYQAYTGQRYRDCLGRKTCALLILKLKWTELAVKIVSEIASTVSGGA